MQMLEVVQPVGGTETRAERQPLGARKEGILMENDENLTVEAKKSTGVSEKVKMIIGSASILAVAILAALVFRSYEAGIPPADLAPTSATTQLIRVSISEQNLANQVKTIPSHAQQAAREQMPSMKRLA
jgi:hypothetical protein